MIWGEESGGGFSLVEHPVPPRHLAAPLHRHSLEDEYSFILEGHLGARLGEAVVFAGPGHLVFKPRHQWHTFWNAGDSPCRILEIISPAGFEHYFAELGDGSGSPEEGQRRFMTETDLEGTQRICEELDLIFPSEPRPLNPTMFDRSGSAVPTVDAESLG